MERTSHPLTFGFPRMHKEAGERRDFLPPLIHTIADLGCPVFVEGGIGSGMGYVDRDYESHAGVHVVDERTAYQQDVVIVLRAPEGRYQYLRPGATLLSMLHFPTRPARVEYLDRLAIHAISLDTIVDEEGHRVVVNGKAVAWNGLDAALEQLEEAWPSMFDARRRPVRVTVMGAGDIGKHAVEAATKYGNHERDRAYAARGMPGVEVVTIGRNLTADVPYMHERLSATDVLVDATQRDDPARPLLANDEIGLLPEHAVICDLVVDPYLLDAEPPTVRGIEGIPQGSLDQYAFGVNDPAWDRLPPGIPTAARRTVVSCYSWPGVHPAECMEHYGLQLEPLLETLIARGGFEGIRRDGTCSERAMWRGSLAGWLASRAAAAPPGRSALVAAGR
jgi:alanine dehydrogenase